MASKNTKSITGSSPKSGGTTHIMVTLPVATRKKIESLASKQERSMAYLCRQFIEQGLNANKKKAAN
jgi:predicted transcriptional regulator